MSLFPALLLFATATFAPTSVIEISNQRHMIPRGNWRYQEIRDLTSVEEPATVKIDFTVESGPPVRVALMRREAVERMTHGHPAGAAIMSAPEQNGHLQVRIPDPTEFAVVIDNRENDSGAAAVRVKIALDYTEPNQGGVRWPSPQRQLAVLAISFAVFFGMVGFSARALWRNASGGVAGQTKRNG